MARKKKSEFADDLTRPHGEHPIITEMLKGNDADQDPIIGIPLPALSARYVFQSNIFPFSRFIQLRGMFSSGKSALLLEFMRWYHMYGGMGTITDTENKASESMLAGILGYNYTLIDRTRIRGAKTAEEWQELFVADSKAIHKYHDDSANKSVVPFLLGVDSVSAVDIDRRVEKATDAGHAAAGHPALARNLSEFMRTALIPMLRRYPITLVATNHLKEEIDGGIFGAPKKYAPGGAALDFYATVTLDMERISAKALNQRGKTGQTVRITAAKNNLGAPHKQIEVNLLWYEDIADVRTQAKTMERRMSQFFYWDWHTASVRLLVDMQDTERKLAPGVSPKLPGLLREVCDIEYKHGTKTSDNPLVWSKALDIPKSEALPEVEAALRLEESPAVLKLVHGLLGINTYKVCDPAVRYREQVLAELREKQQIDQPELMAAARAIDDNVIPAELDPLNQFGGSDAG